MTYFSLEVLNDHVMIQGNKLEKKTSCEEMLDNCVLCCMPRDLFVVMTRLMELYTVYLLARKKMNERCGVFRVQS